MKISTDSIENPSTHVVALHVRYTAPPRGVCSWSAARSSPRARRCRPLTPAVAVRSPRGRAYNSGIKDSILRTAMALVAAGARAGGAARPASGHAGGAANVERAARL